MSALLLELGAIAQREPGAKSLVLSSWGRLLRLVGDALQVGGVVLLRCQRGTAVDSTACTPW